MSFSHTPEPSNIGHFAGSALQHDIAELNMAYVRLLRTAARLAEVEPLAPLLIGATPDVISLFKSPVAGDRVLAQCRGFPLVRCRIEDHRIMRAFIDGAVHDATVINALTKSFPSDLLYNGRRKFT